MDKSIYIGLIGVLIFLVNCDDPENTGPDDIGDEVPTIIPNGDENYLNLNSDYIFDQDKLPVIELTIPNASLNRINNNPAAEEYVEGSLTFEGESVSPVGVRYKGSVGAFVNCLTGTDWANPSGSKTCTKLSMKIKINWEGSDLKFFGLKKLQLHSQNLDPSQMRERLGYWLFRQMGVPAPRSVHAKVMINGVFSGVYALTEQIDGRFARYNFKNGEGNVYKEIWPLNSNGQAHSEQSFLNSLKTNEDENPSVNIIRTFAEDLAASSPESARLIVQDGMNLEEIMAFIAVDRTIRVDDGPFHWYCGSGGCSNHNYYWYEDPVDKKLHLIPWDLDNAFENIRFDANPVTPIADDWGEITADCNQFSYGQFNIQQRSAACDKLTAAWVSFDEEYSQALDQFKNGPLSESSVNAQLDAWEDQIFTATVEVSQLHPDALSYSKWKSSLNKLKADLEYARNN